MFSKKKYPIICLLEIPVEFVAYVIMIALGAQLDLLLFGPRNAGQVGHGFPFFYVIFLVIASILFLISVIWSIVNFIRYTIQKRNKRKRAREATKESRME